MGITGDAGRTRFDGANSRSWSTGWGVFPMSLVDEVAYGPSTANPRPPVATTAVSAEMKAEGIT